MEKTETGRPVKKKKPNYRLMLCGALLVCFALAILFFALFLSQRGKVKALNEQVKTLTGQSQTLEGEKTALQQQLDALYASAAADLPEPVTAQTQALPDLIPQLTESIYVVRLSNGQYQYIKVPEGILADRLTAFRDDAAGYTAAAEATTAQWDLWVVYADKVIGMSSGTADVGFVSADRTTSGPQYTLPAGFTAFVLSLFA